MPRGRSNSLGDLPPTSGNPSSFVPSFLEARAATDLLLHDPVNTANGDSIPGGRPGLNLSISSNISEHAVVDSDSVTAAPSREVADISQDDGPEPRRIDPAPATRFWHQKSLLTCDGGGIRGYASLLMIAELMRCIGRIERDNKQHEIHSSSFAPCEKPIGIKTHKTGIEEEGALICEYLPCHYFDYMIGTSTGGLIAVMLSRWRMSVAECLDQYKTIGRVVFGKPRPLSIVGIPCDKYHKAPLVNAIQKLTRDKTPTQRQGDGDRFGLFPSPSDLSRCAVVANEETINRTNKGIHLFRTYKIDIPPTTTAFQQPRHWETVDSHEIWKICRATTAAPTYFRPQKIGDKLYSDGGVGTNNPTIEAIDEIHNLHRNCLKNVASFGTGMPVQLSDTKKRLHLARVINYASRLLKTARASLTDCERTHENVLRHSRFAQDTAAEFQYFRFNVKDGIGHVSLDEWKEERDTRLPGQMYTTLDMLRDHTQKELERPEVKVNLHNLALQLVRQRRERAKEDPEIGRWERFACCTWYECTDETCRAGEDRYSFNLRGQMREHIEEHHPSPEYRNMTAEEVSAHLKVRLDLCRQLPEFPAGPY